jgi:hypothetical protein
MPRRLLYSLHSLDIRAHWVHFSQLIKVFFSRERHIERIEDFVNMYCILGETGNLLSGSRLETIQYMMSMGYIHIPGGHKEYIEMLLLHIVYDENGHISYIDYPLKVKM